MWLSRRVIIDYNRYCYNREKNDLSFDSPFSIGVTFLCQRFLHSLTLGKVIKKAMIEIELIT